MIAFTDFGKMRRRFGRFGKRAVVVSILGALVLAQGVAAVGAAPATRDLAWKTFEAEGFALRFEYPAGLFSEAPEDVLGAPAGDGQPRRTGRVFTTPDGRATLQVGAFENVDGLTARELRARAVKTSYDGARIEYDRLAASWFVLSGRRGDEVFYERIALTCDGRRIDVWTMTYPSTDGALFDRVVEEMARRYRQSLREVQCR
ncbi:MAG TPA: hypothetical protein PK970_02960 [Hyphomicrobiaceae bacterium]|nr:hypothetical protein [Hyphomicrobiaceae bacterium]